MTRTEQINELAGALAQAQAAMAHARKDSENPFFRSKYADLAAVWDACRGALTSHGLAVIQSPRLVSVGEAVWLVEVETTLLHASGQTISDVLAVPVTPANAQAVGSAITYARRYSLASFVGVAPEDDDGNTASASPASPASSPRSNSSEIVPAEKPRPPAPTFVSVTVKIVKIIKRPLKEDPVRHKFIITADDKANYHTFSLTYAEAAKSAQEAGIAVDITYKDTQYGRMIQTLRETLPEGVPEPPL